jgi:hypothetical protein
MTNEQRTTREAIEALVGRRIVAVRYMTKREASELAWQNRPLLLELDDGSRLYASADEEMNDAGVLWVDHGEEEMCLGRYPN